MKFTNAIKTLERRGFAVKLSDGGHIATATRDDLIRLVTVSRNGTYEEVATIHVKRHTDEADSRSDYFPGSYWPTLKSAIDYMEKYNN